MLIYFGYMNDMNVTFLDTIRPTGDNSENHGDLLGTADVWDATKKGRIPTARFRSLWEFVRKWHIYSWFIAAWWFGTFFSIYEYWEHSSQLTNKFQRDWNHQPVYGWFIVDLPNLKMVIVQFAMLVYQRVYVYTYTWVSDKIIVIVI